MEMEKRWEELISMFCNDYDKNISELSWIASDSESPPIFSRGLVA